MRVSDYYWLLKEIIVNHLRKQKRCNRCYKELPEGTEATYRVVVSKDERIFSANYICYPSCPR